MNVNHNRLYELILLLYLKKMKSFIKISVLLLLFKYNFVYKSRKKLKL